MVLNQSHLSYDDLFETFCPTSGNPTIYYHWKALKCLCKHEQPVRDTKSTPPKRVAHPEPIIIRDAPIPPSKERGEEFPIEEFPAIDEDTPTSKGDSIPPLLQPPTQNGTYKATAPTRISYRRCKASARDLESREQESLNLNEEFSVVQEEQGNQQYYEAMHQDKYKIQDVMQDSLAYMANSDLDTMYFDQAMKGK